MWSAAHLCRCGQILRCSPSKLCINTTRNGLNNQNVIARQFTAPLKNFCTANYNIRTNLKVTRLSNIFKQNVIAVRLSSSSPPPRVPKAVGYWLLGCSGMVFTAVVLGTVTGYFILVYAICYIMEVIVEATKGGVTRLTESGLSMVTWKLLGEKMPTNEVDWQHEFEKYQQFPEYKYKNRDMTLSEFKWIWWMEFAHRTWGRCIGAAVLLPALAFWARGCLDRGMKTRVAVYCVLVAAQGLMGWYMVRSGLEDRFSGPSDVPRVSQHRLAAHLALAFVLHAGLIAGALRVLRPFPLLAARAGTSALALGPLPALAHAFKAMVFFTAVSGAFVAGLDAGLVYNSFPKMGDQWIPDDILAFEPKVKNFTENPTTVQFDHRVMGTLTLALAGAAWVSALRRPLSPVARRVTHAVAAVACLQVGLGICTLLQYVPTPLAASHQAGSLTLLTLAIWLTHEIKLLRYIPK